MQPNPSQFIKGKKIKARNGQETDLYTESGKPVWAVNADGKPICYGRKNSAGDLCVSIFTMGNGRCKKHRGNAPTGVNHPNATNLRRARMVKNLPKHLKSNTIDILDSTDLLSLDYDISLADARKIQLQGGLNKKNAHALLEAIDNSWRALQQAKASGDGDAIRWAEAAVTETMTAIGEDKRQWELIFEVDDHRRKLVETELKRRKQAEQMIPLAVLRDYTARIIDIHTGAVEKHLPRISATVLAEIKSSLYQTDIDPDTINRVMAIIAPIVDDNARRTVGYIRQTSGDGVMLLYGGRQATAELESGDPRDDESIEITAEVENLKP